jgi:ring-1,2-phenylacetyl-CoA epoxidase subunit PaaC
MFQRDAIDAHAEAAGLGPARDTLRDDWLADVTAVFDEARLTVPADSPFISTGSRGLHSEHFGFILSEMQVLQRSFPGGAW